MAGNLRRLNYAVITRRLLFRRSTRLLLLPLLLLLGVGCCCPLLNCYSKRFSFLYLHSLDLSNSFFFSFLSLSLLCIAFSNYICLLSHNAVCICYCCFVAVGVARCCSLSASSSPPSFGKTFPTSETKRKNSTKAVIGNVKGNAISVWCAVCCMCRRYGN